jgi:D-tyrosyl-tRNA(Tyr) deacylase
MIACVQRCSRAAVRVEARLVGSIGAGLLVLVGIEKGDDGARADALADRLVELRIFEDESGRMNRSARDIGADVLIVSQMLRDLGVMSPKSHQRRKARKPRRNDRTIGPHSAFADPCNGARAETMSTTASKRASRQDMDIECLCE